MGKVATAFLGNRKSSAALAAAPRADDRSPAGRSAV
jgi:hypothetical protein